MKNNRQRAGRVKGIIWGVLWACASAAGAQEVYVEVVERSTPGGILTQTSTTRLTSEEHTTRTAPPDSTGYALAHWTVNGARQGTDYGRALNPVTFVVTQAMDAVAVYLPINQDTNGMGVPDWWHYWHYGTLTNAVDSDTDGDGIELAREYALDLNPQVPNTLDGGGVSLRVGDMQLAVVNSNLLVYREQSAPGGLIATRELMLSNGTVQATATAPESGSGYSFAYWQVNSERQANATGTSPFAISVTATQNADVVAVYLPTAQDTNGEGLPDWWQLRHTGTLTNAVDSDADGDGIPLAREYALGLNPNIPTGLDGGGVSLRVGELQLAVVNSNLLVYRERSAPGGFITARELMVSNGTIQTTATAPESGSGYAFIYWTVNGERQANAAGAGFNPLTLTMTQNVDAVAHYTATSLYTTETGIPDWWLQHHTGSLTNAADSDADGDGIVLGREWELQTAPGVANTLDGGGVSLRVGALSSTLQVDPLSDDDADGLTWEREQELGLNPYIANTLDGGGVSLRVGEMGLVDVQVLLGVFLEPAAAVEAGALWRVDGGAWYTNAQYNLMAAGPRWVEFRDADGWEAPAPQTVEIYDQILAITSTYTQVGMGELTVAIEPEEARTAGAQWRLDGPTWETTNNAGLEWRTNGAVVSLTARQERPYGVFGMDVPGWHTPLSQEAWVTNAQRTELMLTYSAAGTLAVTATPPAAAALGGWRVDEGDWRLFGESETLLIGDYELEFQPVAGWHTPTNQAVTISQGATVSIAGEYVFDDAAGCDPLPLDWKRTAEASGEEAGLYAAGNAVDGDLATRWRSPVENDQWLLIDLGRVSTLVGLTIQWDAAYAKAFTVDLSLDGEIWSEVATQTNGVGGLETLYWPPQTARHVRLNLSERFYSQWGFGIWDMDFLSPCGVEAVLPSEATWTPSSPTDDDSIAIRYQPNDGPLAAAHASNVVVRYNVNGGAPTSGMDVAMAVDTNGVWTGQVLAEPGDTRVDFVFHSGNGVWDVTGDSTWGFALRPGANNVVRSDPGTLTRYREYVGQEYLFSVTGSVPGTIWGTGLYKDDSPLAVAAIHAGALTNGEPGTVVVTLEGPQEAFTGSETNGVVSLDFGAWTGSYSVARFMEPELALLGTNDAVIAEGAAASLATGTDFGRVGSGTTPTQALRVVNTGLSDMDVTGAEIAGASSNVFQILGLPLTVSAGQTSVFYLVYAPQATAGEDAEVTLLNNTVRSNFTFGVRGTVPRALSMVGLQVNDKTYDGYISGTVASYGTPNEVEPSDEVTVNTSRVEALFEDAGAGENKPVTVTGWSLEGADAYKYDLGDQMATATIFRATQTLTFAPIADQDWSNRTVSLQATASSGLPVTFNVSGPATSVGNVLTFTSTGVVSVTASQSDANWTPVSETQTFEVYSIGRLTWDPLVPTTGQPVVFTYQPELGPLAGARTAYLDIELQPAGDQVEPGPAMKGNASNGWTGVFLIPEAVTNLQVAVFDENDVRDDGRGAFWQVGVDTNQTAAAAPSNMTGYRDRVGESFLFEITGNVGAGSLWGTDIYTDDSSLAMACVHAGVLAHGEAGVLRVTVLGPQESFIGSTQNGVASSSYGSFPGSFMVEPASATVGAIHLSTNRLNWAVDATDWTPDTRLFAVENTGSEPFEFEVQGLADWMNVTPTSGQVEAGSSCTVDVSWVEQFLPIGEYVCTLEVVSSNVANNPQYLNVLLDVELSNAPAEVVLSDLEQVYDGTVKAATATTDPAGLAVDITYDGGDAAPTAAGEYAVAATVTDPGWLGSATGTLVVAQAPQTISFPALPDQVVTGQVALAATASSGLDVTYELVDGPAELSAGVLSFTGTGTVAVVARQSGDANWETAVDVTNVFTVTKAPATLQLHDLNQVYDGTARIVTATTDPVGLMVQITYDGQEAAPVASGSYAVEATVVHDTYAGNTTGILMVSRASQTVLFAPIEDQMVTNTLLLEAVSSSGLDVLFTVAAGPASISGGTVMAFSGTGTVAVVASQSGDENWEAAQNITNQFEVLPDVTLECLPNGGGLMDDFEDRTAGELDPWHAYAFAELESPLILTSKVSDVVACGGSHSAYAQVMMTNPGVWSGVGIWHDYDAPWALPDRETWSNIVFSAAMCETNGHRGRLTMQLIDDQGLELNYSIYYGGVGWSEISIPLSRFTEPDWGPGFDPDRVTSIVVRMDTGGFPGTHDVFFDNISLACAEPLTHDSAYPFMYFRGTPNWWSTTPMDLVADHRWEIQVKFEADGEFKFDAYGDWEAGYGDTDGDGFGDLMGNDIPVLNGPGTYRVWFDDSTLAYGYEKITSEMGMLRVDIEPAQVRTAGAQWRIPGGTWQDSGTEIPAAAWNYGLVFKDVSGWIAPIVGANVVSGELAVVQAEYSQTEPTMYFRGTANEWELAAMRQIATGQWEIEVQFEETADMPMRFKFDKYGDWSQDYGDNEPDGIADLSGADILITEGIGQYRIRFNEQTLRYSVEKTGGEGLPYWVAIADCFENRSEVEPWVIRTYSENVLPEVTAQGVISTDAYAGDQAAQAVVENTDPGGWSGVVLEQDYPQEWSLPSQAHWSNIVFSAAIREIGGQAGAVTLFLYDDEDREFQWTTEYDGNGWQLISATLDQFAVPDWNTGFDPSRVAGLSISYAMTNAGTFELEFDHVSFGSPLYTPSSMTWQPEAPRANEPITLTYQPNQGVLADATSVVAQVGFNGWSTTLSPDEPMALDGSGHWVLEMTPPVGSDELNVVAGDDSSVLGITQLWDHCFTTNWNIPLGLATQSLEFTLIPDQVVTGQVALSATASSGLGVLFSVASGPAQQIGDLLTFTGPGTVVVVASQSGNEDWEAAPPVTNQFEVIDDVPPTVTFEVVSAYGDPTPATGQYEVAYGTVVSNTLAGAEVVAGSTRHVADGFVLEGGEVLASSATSAVVRLTNNASLTWQWATEHWLAVGAGFHGAVDTGSGWQANNSVITLTAQPSAYYNFDRWLGVAAGQSMNNPLPLEMDAPHSIQAVFKERLTSNGTPEWWLADQGWTNDFEAAAADDPDQDGSPTWEEQVAGTDPNDPTSYFRFEELAFSATHIGLYWPSTTGREYQIEYSTNLTQAAWDLFPNGEQIAAEPPENRMDITVTDLPERHRMLRVSVRLATNDVRHEVAYVAGPNGTITGTAFQELGTGEIGQAVWAVPDDGYEFVRWSDGSTENPRTDVDVETAQVLTAEFAPIAAPPPAGQAIESVKVTAPVVQSLDGKVELTVGSYRNCDGTIEIWRTDAAVDAGGELQYVPRETVVRRMQTPLMAGTTRIHWDGCDDEGMACSNGLYQFRILATNASGETFETYDPVDDTESVEVGDTGISPASPRFRANEPCQLGYSVTSPVAMAVYVLHEEAAWDSWIQFREAGAHLDDWWGRHSTDDQLLDGSFSVSVLARELPENALVLDRQLLADVEAEIYAICPVYDQVTTIHYILAAKANVWVELKGPSGTTALLGMADGLEAGPHSFVWDGKVSDTAIFSEAGDYTLRIVASSEAQGLEQGVSLNVIGQ